MDSNEDGRISRSEFVSGPGMFMQRFDANKDGVVTRDEMQTVRKNTTTRRPPMKGRNNR
ncbi:hypothetical protein MNBD_ALPHA06-1300 [hydrothermal vent metagenome]|uniref:EF-hand domain-containing protein n=1 Tax=hydrothermal vent metagenome TaxID=652676 RepID=A0A3B0RD34_9ZZZZ